MADSIGVDTLTGFVYEQELRMNLLDMPVGLAYYGDTLAQETADSIWIFPTYGVKGTDNHLTNCDLGEWRCKKLFVGRFTDANSLVGVARYNACDMRGSRPESEGLYDTFPMTFYRYVE